MKKCPFCAEDIQDAAVVCRFCGRDLEKKLPTGTVLMATPIAVPVSSPVPASVPIRKTGLSCAFLTAVAIVGVVLCAAVVMLDSSRDPGTVADRSGDEGMAFIMSQEFVKKQLKSPSTAKFPSRSDDDVLITDLGSDRYRVFAWVDSENSFGAMIRTTYLAELRYTGDDNWRLESLTFGED